MSLYDGLVGVALWLAGLSALVMGILWLVSRGATRREALIRRAVADRGAVVVSIDRDLRNSFGPFGFRYRVDVRNAQRIDETWSCRANIFGVYWHE